MISYSLPLASFFTHLFCPVLLLNHSILVLPSHSSLFPFLLTLIFMFSRPAVLLYLTQVHASGPSLPSHPSHVSLSPSILSSYLDKYMLPRSTSLPHLFSLLFPSRSCARCLPPSLYIFQSLLPGVTVPKHEWNHNLFLSDI